MRLLSPPCFSHYFLLCLLFPEAITPQLSPPVLVVEGFQHKKGATGEKDTLNTISKHFAATALRCPEATLVVRKG